LVDFEPYLTKHTYFTKKSAVWLTFCALPGNISASCKYSFYYKFATENTGGLSTFGKGALDTRLLRCK
jgi:hypothetical protein